MFVTAVKLEWHLSAILGQQLPVSDSKNKSNVIVKFSRIVDITRLTLHDDYHLPTIVHVYEVLKKIHRYS